MRNKNDMRAALDAAKAALLLPELLRRLGHHGEIPQRDGVNASCPDAGQHANEDRHPSFGFYAGLTRYKCFGCGATGDGPEMIQWLTRVSKGDAIRSFIEMAGTGGTVATMAARRPARPPAPRVPAEAVVVLPKDFRMPTPGDIEEIARRRGIDRRAAEFAVDLGVLWCGTVHGFPSWIVTDERRRVAEARRMDGELFPPLSTLKARKAHTLAGSKKDWMCGIEPRHHDRDSFKSLFVVEGGPDLLAGYHLTELWCWGEGAALPVAILGASVGTALHPDALAFAKGREVVIFSHKDDAGADGESRWAPQFWQAGAAHVRRYKMGPGEDLNDYVVRVEREGRAG